MAEILVKRTTGAPLWPWLLGLLLLLGTGLVFWAVSDDEDDEAVAAAGGPSISAPGEPDVAAGHAEGDQTAVQVARDATLAVERQPIKLAGDEGAVVAANIDQFDQDRLVVDERVFFTYDSAELTPTGRAKLGDIAAELEADGADWQLLRIEGYSDRRGPKDYNLELSRDRAKAVEGQLATLGVKDEKLDIKAYGESRPLEFDASSPEEYQRNRRVEFTILRAH